MDPHPFRLIQAGKRSTAGVFLAVKAGLVVIMGIQVDDAHLAPYAIITTWVFRVHLVFCLRSNS
ncbi:hypothetical protein GCM10011571_03370 [Marinithermofilum abyssi]|uniref:Uncharacterized protein n=1 Tax=Marinithermofilum abyssi TaxID=1571185 RepID=A0A8J2VE50_9BACL|nr:hypothetical protein GCM10011571_03370 [Marinithermofilum abyssi]